MPLPSICDSSKLILLSVYSLSWVVVIDVSVPLSLQSASDLTKISQIVWLNKNKIGVLSPLSLYICWWEKLQPAGLKPWHGLCGSLCRPPDGPECANSNFGGEGPCCLPKYLPSTPEHRPLSHSHGRPEGKRRVCGLYMFLNPSSLASPFIRHSSGCYKYPEFWDFVFLIYQLFQRSDPPLVLPGLSFCLMSVSVDFARLFCSVDDGVCFFWGTRQPKLWICF